MILVPILGFYATSAEVHTGVPAFGRLSMLYSLHSVGVVGFAVWAHHMFNCGLDPDTRSFFGSLSVLIGVPTSVKLIAMFHAYWGKLVSRVSIEPQLLFLFLFMFVIGGSTGLLLANAGLDTLMHDTYFVVAHFHYILSMGAVTGGLAMSLHLIQRMGAIEYSAQLFIGALGLFFFGSKVRKGGAETNEPKRVLRERWICMGFKALRGIDLEEGQKE